jgi:uncharacterized RDD family membrane protein YckC
LGPHTDDMPYNRDSEFPPVEYAGFWIRFLASVFDSVLLLMVMVPLLMMFYGPEVLFMSESPGLVYDIINYALPIIAVIIFWRYRAATPGKIMMDIYIVDADTLEQPTFGRLLLRYFGYYVSIFTLFLGFFFIGWDKRRQGFHDKIANTIVIRKSGAVLSSADYMQQPGEKEEPVPPPSTGTDP